MSKQNDTSKNNVIDLNVNTLILLLNHINENGTKTVRIKKQVHEVLNMYCEKEKINMSTFTTKAILEKLIDKIK